jgi:hypothetical protein
MLNQPNRKCYYYILLQVLEIPYLGVHIDEKVRWQPQIDKLCKQLRFRMAQLKLMKTKYGI